MQRTYVLPEFFQPSLTKREQVAIQMMAALLANPQLASHGLEFIADTACNAADVLLATLKDSTIER